MEASNEDAESRREVTSKKVTSNWRTSEESKYGIDYFPSVIYYDGNCQDNSKKCENYNASKKAYF